MMTKSLPALCTAAALLASLMAVSAPAEAKSRPDRLTKAEKDACWKKAQRWMKYGEFSMNERYAYRNKEYKDCIAIEGKD
jgi:hypothetical protein